MSRCAIEELEDAAALRVIPAHPALAPAEAEALVAAIAKLAEQFAREGRIERYALSNAAGGGLILFAHVECGEGWSGCRKDMLARVLAEHEARSGSALLAPPPIVLDKEGATRCIGNGALRSQLAVGAIDGETLVWDHLCDRLGEWRRGMPRPAHDVPWLAQAMQRMGGGG